MARRLSKEEVVTIHVLAEKGASKREIARKLGVTEGAVRYQLRKKEEARSDGRAGKRRRADAVCEPIAVWFASHQDDQRPVNVRDLYDHLVAEHDYDGSYNSVRRYVRAHYPKPRTRTYRRVETPPGAQVQTDWVEFSNVDIGNGPQPLSALIMTLSHSRRSAMVWSQNKRMLAWLGCHNDGFERLGGIAAVNRIDNTKTAIVRGAGAWGEIHPAYRAYANQVGFHIDACPPRAGNAKGKVEAKVRLGRLRANPRGRRFDGLEELQHWTDERFERWSRRAICPITGATVYETWQRELDALAPLPRLPEPFDVAVSRKVHRDCLVHFESRSYTVPFAFVGRNVEVRGCRNTVQIVADGQLLREYPRRSEQRLWIDASCYEGEATDEVLPPPPLGRMGRRLQEIYDQPVQQRPIDLYAALLEVSR